MAAKNSQPQEDLLIVDIKSAREKLGISGTEAAARLGFTRQYWSNLENYVDERKPGIDLALRIADVLQTDVNIIYKLKANYRPEQGLPSISHAPKALKAYWHTLDPWLIKERSEYTGSSIETRTALDSAFGFIEAPGRKINLVLEMPAFSATYISDKIIFTPDHIILFDAAGRVHGMVKYKPNSLFVRELIEPTHEEISYLQIILKLY